MTTKEIQQLLKDIGWPISVDGNLGDQTHEAIKDFQRGWAPYPLLQDGFAGPQTIKALQDCAIADGRCGIYFHYREFKSSGNGWIRVDRNLVAGLDRYRERYGPTSVVSGYRDPAYNHSIPGAASNSQHMYGNACDLNPVASVSAVRNLQVFSGIGIIRASGLVRHVDVRHVGPNTTGGTPMSPTIWYYG